MYVVCRNIKKFVARLLAELEANDNLVRINTYYLILTTYI